MAATVRVYSVVSNPYRNILSTWQDYLSVIYYMFPILTGIS